VSSRSVCIQRDPVLKEKKKNKKKTLTVLGRARKENEVIHLARAVYPFGNQ
jgi:hypothetical protein